MKALLSILSLVAFGYGAMYFVAVAGAWIWGL
jgi:hypothetical protein